jgi:hypothetical protein
MNDDGFNLDELRLTPEFIKTAKPKVSDGPRPRKRKRDFVMVPWGWVERLQSSRSAETYRLAIYLLHEQWRSSGEQIKLSNVAVLEGADITRFAKWRALRELEEMGLVKVDRRGNGRSPLVKLVVV